MSQIDSLNFDDKSTSNGIDFGESKEESETNHGLNGSDSTTGPDGDIEDGNFTDPKKSTVEDSEDDVRVESVVTNNDNPRSSLSSIKGRNSGHQSTTMKISSSTYACRTVAGSKVSREVMFQKLEGVKTVTDELLDRIDRIDMKFSQVSEGILSLLDVNQSLKDIVCERINDVGNKVKSLDAQVLKCNSIRHEAKLQVMDAKMDKLEMLMSNMCNDFTRSQSSTDFGNEILNFVQLLDSKVERIKTMIQSDSSRTFASVLCSSLPSASEPSSTLTSTQSSSSSSTFSRNENDDTAFEPGPSRKRTRGNCDTSAPKPKKELKQSKSKQVQYRKEAEVEDLNLDFTFACRHGIGTSDEVGKPMKFARQCRFQTNILSHLRTHRNTCTHGDYLRDGTPADASFRKNSDGHFICIKRDLKNKECGKVYKQISQHNRHARSVLHKDDLLILNNHCRPCGTSFKTSAQLLDHFGKTNCIAAKGVFGKDSIDPDASGITCPSCGVQGFTSSSSVLNHQKSGECIPKENDDGDSS